MSAAVSRLPEALSRNGAGVMAAMSVFGLFFMVVLGRPRMCRPSRATSGHLLPSTARVVFRLPILLRNGYHCEKLLSALVYSSANKATYRGAYHSSTRPPK
jgi:hypothetical protein